MSYTTFVRLAGFAIMVAASVVILFNAFLAPGLVPSHWEYPGYLALNMLLVFALTALYIYHLERSGVLLHAGFVLSAISLFLTIGFCFYAVFAFPTLRAQFPEAVKVVLSGPMNSAIMASMIAGVAGNLLFYIATLRAGQIPRWTSMVLIISAVLILAMLPYNIPAILASIGLIGAGYSMVTAQPAAPQAQLQSI